MDIQTQITDCYGIPFPYMHLYPPMNAMLARQHFYHVGQTNWKAIRTLPQMLEKWLSDNRLFIVRRFLIYIDLNNEIVDEGYVVWNANSRKFHKLVNIQILANLAKHCVYSWKIQTNTYTEYESILWTDYFADEDKFQFLLELSVPHDNTQTFFEAND